MAGKITESQYDAILALILRCKRCGHIWTPKQIFIPNYCPKCKRADWYEKKVM